MIEIQAGMQVYGIRKIDTRTDVGEWVRRFNATSQSDCVMGFSTPAQAEILAKRKADRDPRHRYEVQPFLVGESTGINWTLRGTHESDSSDPEAATPFENSKEANKMLLMGLFLCCMAGLSFYFAVTAASPGLQILGYVLAASLAAIGLFCGFQFNRLYVE